MKIITHLICTTDPFGRYSVCVLILQVRRLRHRVVVRLGLMLGA